VFVSGGTAGNLSALVAARWKWRHDAGGHHDRTRGLIVSSRGAHSSVTQAARVIDSDVLLVNADEAGRMTGEALRAAIDGLPEDERARLFAIVGTAGTTNAGVIDDLAAVADVCEATGAWFHADGAYGAAALAAPSVRERFIGIERADSLIVDPHKWLFAPFDVCALLYRDPRIAKAAHTQHAEYLDVLHEGDDDWNASDYAHHLARRARGLPFWFSLATYGTDAYRDGVETTLRVAHEGAELIRASEHCELVVEPELSVAVFRRIGWTPADYAAWSEQQLADGVAFVVPSAWDGETVLRYCVVNPLTSVDDIAAIIDSLR
jgi:glutamate/tyrosine decarboxylase-like PLP-dependent enzyme